MSEFKGRIVVGVTVSIIVAFGLAVGVLALSPSTTQNGPTSTTTSLGSGQTTPTTTATTSTLTCIFPGQPAGAFISVLASNNSNSFHDTANSTPLSGAIVTAIRNVTTGCGSSTASSAVMETFTTNGSLWYSLSTLNGGTYQITVSYGGHDYTMDMPLGLLVYNCGILYIPSGISNVTTSVQNSCTSSSTTSATTTSSSGSSGTTTSTECTISASGTGLYVTVLSDSGQAVQGAQITGTVITEVGSSTCQQDIGTYVTNSTGGVLITENTGSYYQLSIAYQGSSYAIKAPIAPMETTYVTLMVPSGNVTISEVFEGGCQTSSGSVTCP